MCVIESMISSGQARLLARRPNTLHLVDAATGRPVVTRGGRPVEVTVRECLIAVWRAGAGEADEPAYFLCSRTRKGWHFDPTFGPLAEVWREGPIVERYEIASLRETWGRGRGWTVAI